MTANRRDHFDEKGRYTGHSEDSWLRSPSNEPGGHLPIRVANQRANERKRQQAYEGWRKNFRFHLIATILCTALFLVMLVLTVVGMSNGYTWFLLVLSAIVAVAAAIELPKPS